MIVQIGTNSLSVTSDLNRTTLTATSRSLSGVPYLLTTSYGSTFNSEVSKSFNPCLWLWDISNSKYDPTNSVGIGSTSLSNTISTNGTGYHQQVKLKVLIVQELQREVVVMTHRFNDIAVVTASVSL